MTTLPPWIRRSLIGLAVVLGLLALAVGVLVATFDANRYKGVAIDWMKANRNRTLAIDGPLSLGVFPRLALRAEKLSLSEAGRAERFAAVEQVSLSVALLPLLRGQLQVDHVEARGVQLVLKRDAQGRRNTDDLAGAAKAEAPAAPAASAPARQVDFDIRGVELNDVQATVQDPSAGLDGTLRLAELRTGRLAPGMATPVNLVAELDFRRPALKGRLEGRTQLTPPAADAALALADTRLTWHGDLPGLAAADLELTLARFGLQAARQSLALEKLGLQLKAPRSGSPLALSLDWPALDITGNRLAGQPLQGRLSLGGATPVEVSLRTGAPTGSFESVTLPALELHIGSSAGGRRIDGSARGRLSAGPKAAQWALAGQVNQNAFTLDGNARLDAPVPFVKAQASFDALDLDSLLPAPANEPAPAAAKAPAAAEARIDLAGLKAIDGQFTLRAGSLALRQYRLAKLRLDASLAGGLLRVPQLQAQAWGGGLEASGSANARGNQLALQATASNVDVNALLKDVAGKDLLEGRGRVALDVDTAGATVSALRSQLHGTAALQLRDGAVKGINLAKSLRQAKAAIGLGDRTQPASQAEKTDFSELSASFQIADGVARSNDLDVKSPYLRIGGDGLVDIGRGLIDYTTRVTVTDTAAGQGGADLAALKGLTVPVRLTGPFDAIAWNIRWSAVAAGAVKNKVEEKVKDKLKDRLKGILK